MSNAVSIATNTMQTCSPEAIHVIYDHFYQTREACIVCACHQQRWRPCTPASGPRKAQKNDMTCVYIGAEGRQKSFAVDYNNLGGLSEGYFQY